MAAKRIDDGFLMRGPDGRRYRIYTPSQVMPSGVEWMLVKIKSPAGDFYVAYDEETAKEWSCSPGTSWARDGMAVFSREEMAVFLESAIDLPRDDRLVLMSNLIAGKLAMPGSFRVVEFVRNPAKTPPVVPPPGKAKVEDVPTPTPRSRLIERDAKPEGPGRKRRTRASGDAGQESLGLF